MTLPEPLCTPLSHVCHVYCFRNRQLKATRMVCCEENPIVSARCHVVATPQPKLLSFHAWTVCRERSVAQNPMAYQCVSYIFLWTFSFRHSRVPKHVMGTELPHFSERSAAVQRYYVAAWFHGLCNLNTPWWPKRTHFAWWVPQSCATETLKKGIWDSCPN